MELNAKCNAKIYSQPIFSSAVYSRSKYMKYRIKSRAMCKTNFYSNILPIGRTAVSVSTIQAFFYFFRICTTKLFIASRHEFKSACNSAEKAIKNIILVHFIGKPASAIVQTLLITSFNKYKSESVLRYISVYHF